ncbi:hypothetical protein [Acidisphaera rubrifaciens]|nr:hypothetical protein [Acidisphaera rubrifaciens]
MTDSQLTTFALGIPAPGQTQPAYMYTLRLGAADPKVDNYVVYGENGSYTMAATPTGDDPRANEGIVLYSYDNFTVYSPNTQYIANIKADWSAEALSATVTNGLVSNASYSSKGLISTYASAAQMAINASDLVSFNGGNTMTVWAGNDASTGVGGLLWSNYGATQNIFGGQIVNITAAPGNGVVMNVQGWGEAALASAYAVSAATSIKFSVDPLAVAAAGTPAQKWADALMTASLVVAGVASMLAGIEDVGIGTALDLIGAPTMENYDKIKTTMITAASVSAALSSVIVACQIAAMAAGIVASQAAGSSLGGTVPSFEMTPTSIMLEADDANFLTVTDAGILMSAAPGTTITVDGGSNSIKTPAMQITSAQSIVLMCGTSSITLMPNIVQIRGTSVQVNGANVLTG